MLKYLEFYNENKEKSLFKIELYAMEDYIAESFYDILKEYNATYRNINNALTEKLLSEMLWFMSDEVDGLAMKIIQDSREKKLEDLGYDLVRYSRWHDNLLEISKKSIEEKESIYFIVKGI